ncbi:MAG: dnaE, partial [Myxococcaceae bacterium]|nr:dnaE [Myxococcaceae bacterium]
MYVPLWVKSNHSFLEGASHPEELVERAHALGLDTIALTDRDGVYGAVKAYVKAKELGIKLIIGSQITLTPDLERNEAEQVEQNIVLLAKTRAGYASLCRLISIGRARKEKGKSLVSLEEVQAAHHDLIALCAEPTLLAALKSAFGPDLYALYTCHLTAEERARCELLRARARALSVPLVASTEVLYHDAARRPLQDVVTCIRLGTTLRSAGTRIKPNAEHDLKPDAVMRQRFAEEPDALDNSRRIARACSF